MSTIHYKAFISYSHSDEKWAIWSQKSLESYRVPKRLVGTDGEFGEVPERLVPIFRDREDLSSASDVSAKVKEELEQSEFLIVICSPAAAQSKWVNEEIRHFKSLGSEERVLALIVDGDPVSDKPEEQCFPSALTTNLDGSPGEPLAADVRKWADGKLLARLKLVAGILGLRLDELRRRDQQRRRKNRIIASISAVTVIALTLTLAISAVSSRKAAQLQRTNTEELLSYMLGNLKQLDPIIGLEVVDKNDQQMIDLLQSQGLTRLDNEKLVEWGIERREQGISYHERGELEDAMEQFQLSRAAFIELYQREGSTRRAQFELGQAEFWVGYVYFDSGDLDQAEKSLTRYGAISRRLVNAAPNDAEMVMELSYTLVNLAALEMARRKPDIDQALQLTQSAVQYNQIALVLNPENDAWRRDMAGTVAFLADAWLESCNLGKAFELRQQRVDLARELFDAEPENSSYTLELAYSYSGLASVQQLIPMLDQAQANLLQANILLNQLADEDNGNRMRRWQAMVREDRRLDIRLWTEPPEDLWPEMMALKDQMDAFLEQGALDDYEASVGYASYLALLSQTAWLMDLKNDSGQFLDEAIERLSALVKEEPESRLSRRSLAHAVFDYWERNDASPSRDADFLLEPYLADPQQVQSCADTSVAARLEIMRGNKILAKHYTEYLLGRGYYEPGFVAFCRRYDLCD